MHLPTDPPWADAFKEATAAGKIYGLIRMQRMHAMRSINPTDRAPVSLPRALTPQA